MENENDYTEFAIENILHPIIEAIEQEKSAPEEKKKMIQQAFKEFLEDAKNYQECPGFQNMTVKQLQEEYERLMGKENEEER